MLIGYVSDERYVALADVAMEFERGGECVAVVHSTPRGAVYADVAPGAYDVTLVKEGFGPKHVTVAVGADEPYQFRLLSNRHARLHVAELVAGGRAVAILRPLRRAVPAEPLALRAGARSSSGCSAGTTSTARTR